MTTTKSPTDHHWDDRSRTVSDHSKVNIGDTVQREIETEFIIASMPAGTEVLEVGCGNGHLTMELRKTAKWVDAFDYSEGMIERARRYAGERNNKFFIGNVVELDLAKQYDVVVCVRVLINLKDLAEQLRAIENLARVTKRGGRLILIEGFQNGFEELSALRASVGLPAVTPAAINLYSRLEEILPHLTKHFDVEREFDTGMYDFLTRVVYPLLVGADGVKEAGDFHVKTLPLSRGYRVEELKPLARLRGFALVKR